MKQAARLNKWIVVFALISFKAGAQERHEFSVQQAVEYAMKNSAQVKNALIGVQIQEQTNREITSAAYPQLTGNISANYFPKIPIQTFPNFIATGTYHVLQQEGVKDGSGNPITVPADVGFIEAQFGTRFTGTAGVDLNQTLFDGQVFVGLQARSAAIDYAKKAAEITQEQIKANIYKIYWQLIVGRNQIATIDANIERSEKLLHDTREIYKNGFAEKLDVSKVEVSLTNLKTERLRIENLLQSGLLGLKILLGMPARDQLHLTDTLSLARENELKTEILEGTYAYSNRKEYQQIELAKKLGEFNVKRYKYTYFPVVSAFGSYSFNAMRNNFDFFDFEQKWFPTALVGFRINVPIFDGFAKDARINKAKFELAQTLNNMENLKLSIDQEVEAARIDMRSAVASLELQRKNMDLAEEVYNQTKLKFEQGLGSTLEITNAESDLKVAQNNYYSALYDAIISIVDYRKATGTL
ncbi:MAG TPA: TolC family protein [Chitinophagaceae bacterium]|nr:TolC family protein [Chitinophagaceae bacterium]